MANQSDPPIFRSGDELTPELLNQLADAVARRITAQPPIFVRAAARQIVIGFDGPNGKPFYYNTVPAKVSSADPLQVDLYEDGYSKDSTKQSIDATAIDDTATFAVTQRVSVFLCRGLYYVISGGGGDQDIPALIRLQLTPSTYQVDLCQSGFDGVAGQTVTATVVDTNSYGNFTPGPPADHVSVFLHNGHYYIETTKPWVPSELPPNVLGRITSVTGASIGVYGWKRIDAPGPGGTIIDPVQRNATEASLSTVLQLGDDLLIANVGGNTFIINKPLKVCGP